MYTAIHLVFEIYIQLNGLRTEKKSTWLATNTDDITTQSDSLFAFSREQSRQVENRLNNIIQYVPCF